jgi:hypothetical protein
MGEWVMVHNFIKREPRFGDDPRQNLYEVIRQIRMREEDDDDVLLECVCGDPTCPGTAFNRMFDEQMRQLN